VSEAFKFEGGIELEKALMDLPQATSKRVGRFALRKAGAPILKLAKSLAPDDPATGAPDLKSSMKMAASRWAGRSRSTKFVDPDQIEMHIGPSSEGYPQAIMQEVGTRHHAAQPYMRPAWDREGGVKAMDRIAKPLWEAIERAAAKAKKG